MTTSKTLTYEEWIQLPETDEIEEIVNGEIRKIPPNEVPHALTVENLAGLLKEKLDRRTVQVLVTSFALRISPFSSAFPDARIDIAAIWSN